uniref:Chromosome 8 open reading frame 48 n=1 Tax=Pelusios castaneus TaxID=367368 RepID=A0A8C8RP85_9SAUR
MELDQSYSTTVSDYCEDTFESFSEEEEKEEACRQYENELFESYCSTEESEWPAVSDISESIWQPASQDDEGDQSELLDSATTEKELTGKWISRLKNKEANIKQGKSIIKTHTKITEESNEELDALHSFCTIKINQIHDQLNVKQSNSHKYKVLQHGFTSRKPVTGGVNCTIPDQLVNRIYLKNISETMKQVTETKVHQPSECPDCKKKGTELAKISFLRRKKTLVEEALLQDKLEQQIYVKDSLTLIGEIHESLPKLSEDPSTIWQRLNEKGQNSSDEH